MRRTSPRAGTRGRPTYYLMGEFSLSMADIEHVLALEPRHFGALSGLGFMFEAMDEPELALEALEAVQALNPNRPNVSEAIDPARADDAAKPSSERRGEG